MGKISDLKGQFMTSLSQLQERAKHLQQQDEKELKQHREKLKENMTLLAEKEMTGIKKDMAKLNEAMSLAMSKEYNNLIIHLIKNYLPMTILTALVGIMFFVVLLLLVFRIFG